MKKITRREFMSAVGAAGAVSILAGCAQDAASTATSTSTAASSTAADSAATTEKTKLIISVWSLDSSYGTAAILEQFKADHPEYDIEVIDTPNADYTTKLTTMLNGGDEVDVFYIKGADTTVGYFTRGQLEDLGPYIERDNFDTSLYNGLVENNFTLDGTVCAMPCMLDSYVIFYNKDLFDQAGVEYPSLYTTWEEYEELCEKMTSGEGADKIYGAYIHSWANCVLAMAVPSGEHTVMDPDTSYLKPYYERVLRMQENGVIMDYATITTGSMHYNSAFASNSYATLPMASWTLNTMIGKVANGEMDINWDITKFPYTDDADYNRTASSCSPMGINSNSANKEGAWQFLKFACGIEGAKFYATNGNTTAIATQEIREIGAAVPGMAEHFMDTMDYAGSSFYLPVKDYATQVLAHMETQHSLMMLGEIGIDEGLAELSELITAELDL